MISHDKNGNVAGMDRNRTAVYEMSNQLDDDFVPGTPRTNNARLDLNQRNYIIE